MVDFLFERLAQHFVQFIKAHTIERHGNEQIDVTPLCSIDVDIIYPRYCAISGVAYSIIVFSKTMYSEPAGDLLTRGEMIDRAVSERIERAAHIPVVERM